MADTRAVSRRDTAGWGGVGRVKADPDVSQAIADVDEYLRRRFGARSPFAERVPTWGQLATAGLVKLRAPDGSIITPGTGAFPDATPIPTTPDPSSLPRPPAPTGLIGTGAQTVVILQWDRPVFTGFAYTEVWESGANNLGSAALVGETPARVFADSVGSAGVTRYYWIRHVNIAGVAGDYNAVPGVAVTTGSASGGAEAAAFEALIVARGVIVSALIGDAEIATAKIADLAVTDAKISALSVGKLTAGALAVGQYIQSSNYTGGSLGWRINSDGSAEFRNIVARGNIEATALNAATGTFTGSVVGGTFTGGVFTGGQFNGGTFIGNVLRNAGSTNVIDLTATGSAPLLRVGNPTTQWDGSTHSNIELNANGTAYFADVVISRPVVVASGVETVNITHPSTPELATGP